MTMLCLTSDVVIFRDINRSSYLLTNISLKSVIHNLKSRSIDERTECTSAVEFCF